MYNVFVYGSLKRDYWNHDLLTGSHLLTSRATTRHLYIMLNLGRFPAVIDEPGPSVIHGEIYTVNADILTGLDWLEGHPHFYIRKLIPTNVGDAWMYFLNCPETRQRYHANQLPTGCWP